MLPTRPRGVDILPVNRTMADSNDEAALDEIELSKLGVSLLLKLLLLIVIVSNNWGARFRRPYKW